MLKNPFYLGLIRLWSTNEIFEGAHEPLISKALFDRVQTVLEGRYSTQGAVHHYLFRQLLACKSCGYSLIGERQKGHVHYRCHMKTCPVTCVREEAICKAFSPRLVRLSLSREERAYLATRVAHLRYNWASEHERQRRSLELRLGRIRDRLALLTDAYLDGTVEKELFEERKAGLLLEWTLLGAFAKPALPSSYRFHDPNAPRIVHEFLMNPTDGPPPGVVRSSPPLGYAGAPPGRLLQCGPSFFSSGRR
jgi:site-specific DNA recombinase